MKLPPSRCRDSVHDKQTPPSDALAFRAMHHFLPTLSDYCQRKGSPAFSSEEIAKAIRSSPADDAAKIRHGSSYEIGALLA
jgi:hypothetical protein